MKDLPNHIKQLKSRQEFDTFWELHTKQDNLQSMLSDLHKLNEGSQQEVLKYIPVSLIAMLESLFRSCIKRLIDEREEYFENTKDLLSEGNLKIGFDSFKYLHRKEFSFGEFISHQVACNNLEGINSTFSKLLFGTKAKKDFLTALKEFNPPTIGMFEAFDGDDFNRNYEKVIKNVARTFELRHIICHEMSLNLKPTGEEILELYKSVHLFYNRIYQYVSHTIYPQVPMTQTEMIETALKQYSDGKTELENILKELRKHPENYFGMESDIGKILQAHLHWNKFMELYSEGICASLEGGRDYQILLSQERADLIKERIDDLKFDFNLEEKS